MENEVGMRRRRRDRPSEGSEELESGERREKGALPRGVHTEKPNSSGFSDPKCKPTKRNEDLTQDAKIEIFH
jgi:hypothetical protein